MVYRQSALRPKAGKPYQAHYIAYLGVNTRRNEDAARRSPAAADGAILVIFTWRVALWSTTAAQSAGPAGPEKAILAPVPDSPQIARRRSPQARSRLTPAPPRIDW
jgi:hypothetical protein